MTAMNLPTQTEVMRALQSQASGMTTAMVAQALGLGTDVVGPILENLYVSSKIECRRVGEMLYRLIPKN